MTSVWLLWLHDSVLGVFGTRRKALLAARRFRSQAEYRELTWVRSGTTDRWHTAWGSLGNYMNHVSRLEVEPRVVR